GAARPVAAPGDLVGFKMYFRLNPAARNPAIGRILRPLFEALGIERPAILAIPTTAPAEPIQVERAQPPRAVPIILPLAQAAATTPDWNRQKSSLAAAA
uniref:hypothetical protein n=1 Tax=Acidiphilium sp. TaxID=527 RepID=UPI0025847BC3